MKVAGEGPLDCKIAFVGEAPGATEDRTGRPFVGRAGQLLDQLMQQAGIIRADCRIENVVQIRPKDNDIKHFCDLSRKEPKLTEEYHEGKAALIEALKQCSANVIVVLGNVPLWTLTGVRGITKYRGSVLHCNVPGLEGRKVIACIHPSAADRNFEWQRLVVMDLMRAQEEAEYPEIREPQYKIITEPSCAEAISYLDHIQNVTKQTACDIEITGTQIRCIAFTASPTDAMCITFTKGGREFYSFEHEKLIWRRIAEVLEDPDVNIIFQNGIFDTSFLYESLGIVTRNIDDTMVAQAILMPDYPKGLDFITSTRTRHPYYKDEGKIWKLSSPTYEQELQFWQYNGKDVIICAETMPGYIEELKRQGNYETYRRQMRLYHPLTFIQSHGIRVDHERLEAASAESDTRIKELERAFKAECGLNINLRSPKQLATYFYITLGLTPYKKGGKVTTDVDAMKRLKRKGVKEADILLKHRSLEKLRGTYYEMEYDDDKRFRGAQNIVGTETGRISSSQMVWGTGGNTQNQPPAMKRFFIADPNHVIYNIDLSQAENRVVAYVAPENAMIDAFENGLDVHSLTAGLISGESMDKMKEDNKLYEEAIRNGEDPTPYCCPLGSADKTWRFWGKKANHALNYGYGYKSFALKYELPEKDAKFLVERYHQAYPGVRQGLHTYVQECLRRNRTITNPYGRKRVFLGRWGEKMFNEAYAQIPQSTVADKMWADGVCYTYEHDLLSAHVTLLNCVHDSLVYEVSLDASWATHALIARTICESLEASVTWKSRSFVIPCDLSMGTNMKELIELDWRDENLERKLEETYGELTNVPTETIELD